MPAINVLFENKDLLAVEKPSGMLSEGDGKDSVLTALFPAHGALFPVHRLDRETGGVLLLAKTSGAAARLSEAFRNREVKKEYLALLSSEPEEKEGGFCDLLFFDRSKNKVFPVKKERRGVKDARLRYKVEAQKEGVTLVRVFPETGRTHQIRVQFASRRLPLLGDRKYGGKPASVFGLYCTRLQLPGEAGAAPLTVSATPSGELWDLFFKS